MYAYKSSIEAKIDSSSTELCLFSNIFHSSKCENFIMSQVCPQDDVSYGMYETDSRVAIDAAFCQHVKSLFIKHMDKIKNVGLILKVSYHLPLFMA